MELDDKSTQSKGRHALGHILVSPYNKRITLVSSGTWALGPITPHRAHRMQGDTAASLRYRGLHLFWVESRDGKL
jgi:hypothetical protein